MRPMTRDVAPGAHRTLSLWLCALMGVAFALLAGACEAIRKPPRDEGRCDPDHPCEEGKVCIPNKLGGSRGLCAKECKDDTACETGKRCTGRYQKLGTVDRYCRRATGALGAACDVPLEGCQAGLRCFAGKCIKECAKDTDCSGIGDRCLPITVDTVVEKDQVALFSACLPAVESEGKPCKHVGPFCGRGLVCHNDKCTRECAKDADCPKGQVCDGGLYMGLDREERAKLRKPPDRRYCRQGAKKNRPCHHNLDVGCAAGLACIKFHCRELRNVGLSAKCDPEKGTFCQAGLLCHAGACRKPCLEDRDCQEAPEGDVGDAGAGEVAEPPRRRRGRDKRRASRRPRGKRAKGGAATKCQEVLFQGRQQRVCL